MADDGPPVARADTFAVPLDSATQLTVLSNDTAAYGSLVVTSATASDEGVTNVCADASCVSYTPKRRFSGWDAFTYTAEDARGRLASATARVRVATTPPRLLGLPQRADVSEGAPLRPFSGADVAYDDAVWTLVATVTLELDTHSGNATRWPAGTLSLLSADDGMTGGSAGSVGAQASLAVAATGAHAVRTTFRGNTAQLATQAARFAVTPPPRYGGAGVVRLQVCSEWGECTVSSPHKCQECYQRCSDASCSCH